MDVSKYDDSLQYALGGLIVSQPILLAARGIDPAASIVQITAPESEVCLSVRGDCVRMVLEQLGRHPQTVARPNELPCLNIAMTDIVNTLRLHTISSYFPERDNPGYAFARKHRYWDRGSRCESEVPDSVVATLDKYAESLRMAIYVDNRMGCVSRVIQSPPKRSLYILVYSAPGAQDHNEEAISGVELRSDAILYGRALEIQQQSKRVVPKFEYGNRICDDDGNEVACYAGTAEGGQLWVYYNLFGGNPSLQSYPPYLMGKIMDQLVSHLASLERKANAQSAEVSGKLITDSKAVEPKPRLGSLRILRHLRGPYGEQITERVLSIWKIKRGLRLLPSRAVEERERGWSLLRRAEAELARYLQLADEERREGPGIRNALRLFASGEAGLNPSLPEDLPELGTLTADQLFSALEATSPTLTEALKPLAAPADADVIEADTAEQT